MHCDIVIKCFIDKVYRIRILVIPVTRVVLQGQSPIGLLQVAVRDVPLQTQNLVIALHGHGYHSKHCM